MSFPDVIDLSSDDEGGEAEVEVRNVKQEPGLLPITNQDKGNEMYNRVQQQRSDIFSVRQVFQGNGSCGHLNTTGNNFRIPDERISAANGLNSASKLPLADQGTSAANGFSVASKSSPVDQRTATSNGSCFASKLPPAPITRQFWKAGEYDDTQAPKVSLQSGQNHLRVHPKFLHSNATSHKWAFGAIAELLDNAFDEIGKGASFVMVDKASNPRDGRPLLLIQDDGGGMDPESMRRCMSFGFSDKKSKSAIGQYGNGFKTSTMRLGADVIVFSRHAQKREFTQSVGLLSYTFLRQTGHDRIVVPMVDYEFDASIGKLRALSSYSAEHFSSNISMLLQWSPYGTEAELLKQFDDIGRHGTKVLIYNLWYNDDGDLELDFESDAEDILISGAPKIAQTSQQSKMLSQQHVANRFQYSLRVYSSILYLRVPKPFRIILRGRVVEHHNLADDLKFPEFILYKPHVGGNTEGQVVTTIGFLKDAPHVNIHGFSVYHKNRLIMPFWRVVSQTNSRGRGVAGVLEANFIEPTHNKQEFEKTSLFLKLESRLKDMTLEYWDYHCILIGYNQVKKASASVPHSKVNSGLEPVKMNPSPPVVNSPRVVSAGGVFHDSASARSSGRPRESPATYQTSSQSGLAIKRKAQDYAGETAQLKRQAGSVANVAGTSRNTSESQSANGTQNQLQNPEAASLMQENKKLQAQCLEYEKIEEELSLKVEQLKIELIEVQHEYARLQAESKSVDTVKEEET